MKLVLISDTHLRHNNVLGLPPIPDGDVLIHAGDACVLGRLPEFLSFFDWFSKQPHKYKVYVAGNHDRALEEMPERVLPLIPGNVCYLQDQSVEIEGFKVYGSPWQPEFCDWAFNLPRGARLREKWAAIPQDTQILITHGPPAGILDQCIDGERGGCEDLRRRVGQLHSLQLHVFGHIHHAYGMKAVGRTLFANAAICDEDYVAKNPPLVVEL